MKTLKAALLLLALSVPLWAANPEKHPDKDKHGKHDSVAVPEGGGTIAYLLVSGAAIGGYLLVRKRSLSRSVK